MYNGYTETNEQIQARSIRRVFNQDAVNLYLRQTSERDADELANIIDWVNTEASHINTATQAHPADVANEIESHIDAELYDFTPFPKDMPVIDMDKIDEIPL